MHESNNEIRQREGAARMFRLFDAQQKELTPTMLRFEHDAHVLRVDDDTYGGLTVQVRDRQSNALLHRVRFPRKPYRTGLAVVYNFRKADSLNRLAFEPDLLEALTTAAAAHDAFLADLITKRASRHS
jgi:hypothetical protein